MSGVHSSAPFTLCLLPTLETPQNGFHTTILSCMFWPEAIAMAIDGIKSATFLTKEEKRDIFYNNAARFLRLKN